MISYGPRSIELLQSLATISGQDWLTAFEQTNQTLFESRKVFDLLFLLLILDLCDKAYPEPVRFEMLDPLGKVFQQIIMAPGPHSVDDYQLYYNRCLTAMVDRCRGELLSQFPVDYLSPDFVITLSTQGFLVKSD